MKASVDLELYRSFTGELRRRFGALTIAEAGIRIGFKRKLPLLVLYAPPAIATVIFSFLVWGKFAAEQELLPSTLGGGVGLQQLLVQRTMRFLEVKNQIVAFDTAMAGFGLLAAAWFGSGLLCEDRRAGAHQLYFSRPLGRLAYVTGKFLVAAFFAMLPILVPGLVIVLVASFASPDWSFLRQESEVLPATLAYGLIWTLVTASLTLASSSLAPRRGFALAGVIGAVFFAHALGAVLADLAGTQPSLWWALSPMLDLGAVGMHLFDVEGDLPVEPGPAALALALVVALSWTIVFARLRRLAIVA